IVFMKYTRKVLKNGLRVITIPMPSFESATAMVMVGAGSRYETPKNTGISHFLEHMAFKGTTKRPSAMDIASLIDGVGGECNAFTSKEITGYYVKAAASNIDLCLDVLSDMLQHSKFDQGEIDKEKGVILEEKNLYEDTPSRHIGDLYEILLYGDTPLGREIIGTKEVISGVNRQNFVDYMQSLYSANNLTVVVAGGIKTVSVHNQEKHALSVLSAISGGGMSSRLFSEVREKRGLAYYVRTGSEHYQDVGNLVSTAGLDPKRVEEGISVIVNEYAKIASAKSRITKPELTKAKELLKGNF